MPRTGRPPKYRKEMIDQVEKLGGLGLNFEEIANVLGINSGTFIRYRKKHPEFSQALKMGVDKANTKVISSLFNNATIKDNLGAQIFWLKNRKGWKDQIGPLVDQSNHYHVTIFRNPRAVEEESERDTAQLPAG